jgi:hypothetical protein
MKRLLRDDDEENQSTKRIKLFKTQSLLRELPIDVLSEIFAFIPCSIIIHNLTLVNKYFHDLITGDYEESITSDEQLSVIHNNDTRQFWSTICHNQYLPVLGIVVLNDNKQVNTKAVYSRDKFLVTVQPKCISLSKVSSANITSLLHIEPFVTKLKLSTTNFSEESILFMVLKQLLTVGNQKLFPSLTHLSLNEISLAHLVLIFNNDLSRFKYLKLNSSMILDNHLMKELKTGSLEELELYSVSEKDTTVTDLLDANSNTLKKFTCRYGGRCDEKFFESLMMIETLRLTFGYHSGRLNIVPLNNLKVLCIHGGRKDLSDFFTVNHPQLRKVTLMQTDSIRTVYAIEITQQKSITEMKLVNTHPILARALLQTLNVEELEALVLKSHPLILPEEIQFDLSKSSKLRKLKLQSAAYNIRPIIVTILPIMSQLTTLALHTVDKVAFEKVIKLEQLRSLEIQQLEMSFIRFTRYSIKFSTKLKILEIHEFRYGDLNDTQDQLYIIPPHIEIFCVTKLPGSSQTETMWILYLIATYKLENVTYNFVKDVAGCIAGLNNYQSYMGNPFFSVAGHVINTCKELFQSNIDTYPIAVDPSEKVCILNHFMKQLDFDYLKSECMKPKSDCIFTDLINQCQKEFNSYREKNYPLHARNTIDLVEQ